LPGPFTVAAAFQVSVKSMQTDHKNVLVLGTCQMLAGTGRGIFMVTSPAVAIGIAPHLALATLPTALIVIGSACGAMPASLFTRRVGRRTGFICGTMIAMLSGLSCAAAVVLENFYLLALGGFLYGLFASFAQLYRFAVADAAHDDFRAKAISLVLAGGVFAGFAGPNLANLGKDLIANHMFVGSFLFSIGAGLLAAVMLMFLDIPNLTKAQRDGPQRLLIEIMKQPVFIMAAVSATVAQCVMNFLMTATPIAMISKFGHSFGAVAIVISSHVVAMYAPGFFTGTLIKRFGEVRIIMIGLLLESTTIAIALSGIAVFDFWLAMIMLGLGWNFTYTGATSLMTTAYTPAERAKTQGMMNQTIYTVVAVGSLSSGVLIHFFGWQWVNIGAMPLLLIAAVVMVWGAAARRKADTA
jgi:MFS family permease